MFFTKFSLKIFLRRTYFCRTHSPLQNKFLRRNNSLCMRVYIRRTQIQAVSAQVLRSNRRPTCIVLYKSYFPLLLSILGIRSVYTNLVSLFYLHPSVAKSCRLVYHITVVHSADRPQTWWSREESDNRLSSENMRTLYKTNCKLQ